MENSLLGSPPNPPPRSFSPAHRLKVSLTGHRVGAAVLLGIAVTLRHRGGAGFGLVGAQGLPLLHQPVLVPQVVLHVRLEGREQQVVSSKLATS